MNLFIDKLCVHLTIPSQPDYSTTVFLVFFPVLFVVAIVWWVRKIRAVEEMDGIWYCRELKIQISLADPNNAFIMQSGEIIQCRCEKEATKHNIGMIDVFCREWKHPCYKYGKTFFRADILQYNEMSLVVYDRKAHWEYTFVRTDKIG